MTDETALYVRVRGRIERVAGRSAVVGRSRGCEVQLDADGVSRRHCEVLLKDDGVAVRDLGSTHGTYLDGRRIAGEERLYAGVLVQLGAHGPHFDVVNAIVHGRPVLGPSDPGITQAPSETPTVAAATSRPPAADPRAFFAGVAWGFVAGLVVGTAVVVLTS